MPHRGSRHGVPRWGGGDLERVALSVVGGSVEDTNHPGRADHLAPDSDRRRP
jgi:hypothetical protein